MSRRRDAVNPVATGQVLTLHGELVIVTEVHDADSFTVLMLSGALKRVRTDEVKP